MGSQQREHSNEAWLKAWADREWVRRVVRRCCRGRRVDPDEFLFEGLKGWVLAHEKFERLRRRKGVACKFKGVAYMCISACVRQAIRVRNATVSVPTVVAADAKGWVPTRVRDEAGDVWTFIEDPGADEPLDPAARESVRLVDAALSLARLTPRQSAVVRLAFGLGPGGYERSNEAIAAELGISRGAVATHKNLGLRMLREHIEGLAGDHRPRQRAG